MSEKIGAKFTYLKSKAGEPGIDDEFNSWEGELSDPRNVDNEDLSIKCEKLEPEKFKNFFNLHIKKCQKTMKNVPEYFLAVRGEKLGKNENEIVNKLYALNDLLNSAGGQYIQDLKIRSYDKNFPNLAPDVWNEKIRFELLED